ncbi:MAG: hypothetical protein E7J63_21705 [Pantoea sp.]|uniref:hypothetical protein n=1 Tax=Pantoea TaxID=53335 RepID=UPI000AC63548|nr:MULTISPECIES: hypothetical protein [Pantoea]MBS6437281.1 hypothetical protein [Pantoea sp.]MDU1574596.1 hypothetical protein [Pantoea sp.]MDU2729636.1 hypothetical protein [Pantoea sp.]MDU5473800.1 hypothetical protein [Pantoea sp.]MDU7840896.1 hypothetical protein [Pantoea sp.]
MSERPDDIDPIPGDGQLPGGVEDIPGGEGDEMPEDDEYVEDDIEDEDEDENLNP